MGSSVDDGSSGPAWALYGVVPVSSLLLFWIVASVWNVQTKRARRQRLQQDLVAHARSPGRNARARRDSEATPVRGPSRGNPLELDLELAQNPAKDRAETSLFASGKREGTSVADADADDADAADAADDDDAATDVVARESEDGDVSETSRASQGARRSDTDSAFETSTRGGGIDPRRARVLEYVRGELSEMSGRYERLVETASADGRASRSEPRRNRFSDANPSREAR